MINKFNLSYQAAELRKQFGEDDCSYIDVFNIVENDETITLFYYPMNSVSGMCLLDGKNKIIAINSLSSKGRQRYTLAHELYHLYYHKNNACFVCSKNDLNSKKEQEKEADIFASYFLAPFNAFKKFADDLKIIKGYFDINDVIKCEQYFGLSHIATLVRLKEENYITEEFFEECKILKPAPLAKKLGFTTDLYVPNNEATQKYTTGRYINLANKLKENDLVSNAKYEQFLLECFRKDLVYGDGGDGGDGEID